MLNWISTSTLSSGITSTWQYADPELRGHLERARVTLSRVAHWQVD
jgi:hypothetical protein